MTVSETGGVNGGNNASLWTRAAEQKKKTPEEQPNGLTASFTPNGGTFLDAVRNIGNSTGGNNCAGI